MTRERAGEDRDSGCWKESSRGATKKESKQAAPAKRQLLELVLSAAGIVDEQRPDVWLGVRADSRGVRGGRTLGGTTFVAPKSPDTASME